MKQLLLQIFTWWNGQTAGTRLWTWWSGDLVGEDEFGNLYYRAPSAIPASIPERRWVIYNGYADASMIPAAWHGWMHHTVDHPPTERPYAAREWEKPHLPNLTGSTLAYHPPGSILVPEPRDAGEPHYEPWRPE
ncbi:MAG TPA: NADH:ubiquinone oxidoreductase subunit NDUFA12 [Aestuariivirgaceae bacterium]|nr:NADH:ubiquinone oxidoreductase subunit NDUFA12 [Aestuariivirgaceae bacterium]